MPFVERERYKISGSCRLHPDNDLFRDQEQHKIKADVNEWQCGYCKKSFLSEEFLDRHFDSRHYNVLNIVSWIILSCSFSLFPYENAKLLQSRTSNLCF